MKTKTLILAISVVLMSLNSGTHAAEHDEKSWIATRCGAYPDGHCHVPFYVALARAEDFVVQEIGVQLRGYLVKEPGGYALYESRSSAQRGWRTDAILIQTPGSEEVGSSLAKRDQSLVTIRGKMVLAASENDEYWVQLAIDKPVKIAPTIGDRLKR
jgi:hypothetical protein